MTWLKDNWFKLNISICVAVFTFSFLLQQYIEIKKHNLEVHKAVTDCIRQFNGDTTKKCAEVMKLERIKW